MLAVSLDGLARLNWLSVPVNRLARLNLAVTLRYLRSRGLRCLRVSLRLSCLRCRSLLSLCGYVGVSLRLYCLAITLGYLSIALRRLGRLTGLIRLTGLSGLVGRSKVRHRPVAGSILALRTSKGTSLGVTLSGGRGTSMSAGRSTNLGSSRGASLRGTLCDTCLCLCLCLCLRLGEVGV